MFIFFIFCFIFLIGDFKETGKRGTYELVWDVFWASCIGDFVSLRVLALGLLVSTEYCTYLWVYILYLDVFIGG